MSGMDQQLADALEAARRLYFDASGAACDYAALASSAARTQLAACLAALEGFDIKRAQVPAQMAFWINAFNAGVLRDASELRLAASAREVQAFFERPRLRIGAHPYSLDDIEHGLLRGNMPKQGSRRTPMQRDDPRLEYMPILFDERVHFAVHSACRSSLPLRVFEAGKLDRQLEEATADYVRRNVRVESQGAVLVVPKLFHWFAEDFGGASSVVEFVVARIEDQETVDAVDRRLGDVKLKYPEFDWTLNRR